MIRAARLEAFVLALGVAAAGLALNPGTDLYVPAAARVTGVQGGVTLDWKTDLDIYNPGDLGASVEIYWLPRDTDNSGAVPKSFTVGPGQTLELPDVILKTFGVNTGNDGGAFRVVASQPVTVIARIFNTVGDGSTFGQGLEGIPASAAVAAGSSTDITGLASTGTTGQPGTFRSNIFAVNTSTGTTQLTFTLLDTDGNPLGSPQTVQLPPRAAFYERVDKIFAGSFTTATLHVAVDSGSAIVVGSKNDNGFSDGTTLESWWLLGGSGGPADGTYQLGIYDSLGFATGGFLTLARGNITAFDASYLNFDRDDDQDGQPDCPWTFALGAGLPLPLPVASFAGGVTFTDSYDPDAASGFSGGDITWTVTFSFAGGSGFSGAVEAVGSGFSGADAGCNGSFPVLELRGGVQ